MSDRNLVGLPAQHRTYGSIEAYGFPGFDSATSVATTDRGKGAWFRDSEGNLLGIVQFL